MQMLPRKLRKAVPGAATARHAVPCRRRCLPPSHSVRGRADLWRLDRSQPRSCRRVLSCAHPKCLPRLWALRCSHGGRRLARSVRWTTEQRCRRRRRRRRSSRHAAALRSRRQSQRVGNAQCRHALVSSPSAACRSQPHSRCRGHRRHPDSTYTQPPQSQHRVPCSSIRRRRRHLSSQAAPVSAALLRLQRSLQEPLQRAPRPRVSQ